MSPRPTVRIGFAAVALFLAGCAAEPPVEAGAAAATCDLLCRFLRLLDLDEAPPAPIAAVLPPSRPKVLAGAVPRHTRRQPAPPAHPIAPTPVVATEPPPVPFQPPPPPVLAVPDEVPETMPGSPEIAPPWFEPWRGPRVP